LTYEELYEKALKKTNGNLNHLLDEFIKNESNKNLSIQDISGNILKFVYELSGLNGNSIIISISPPFYPSHLPSENTDGYKTIERIANNIIEYSKEFLNIKMELSKFYQISDLAFLPIGNIDSLDYIYNNMPGSKSLYNLSLEKMNSLNVPTIVLGAPGKDFHKITERLNIDYALNNLPKLYVFSINKILKNRR
jgi:arginine utilization protein RocB